MNKNSTTDYQAPILSKRPGIQGGEWCVEGTRIRRSDVRAYVHLMGKEYVKRNVYPQLTSEEIDFCITRMVK